MATAGGSVPYRTLSTSDFIKRFSALAQTSQFRAVLQINTLPFTQNYNPQGGRYYDDLSILCTNASLPGSSFSTTENLQDYYGINQTFAYRRDFDDLNLEFFVPTSYSTIKFFEQWMDFISGPGQTYSVVNNGSPKNTNSFYRFQYPKSYKCTIDIHKFNKDYDVLKQDILYTFVNAYPTSIASIPVSYEASSLLKVSVTFKYDRYFVNRVSNSIQTDGSSSAGSTNPSSSGPTNPSSSGPTNTQATAGDDPRRPSVNPDSSFRSNLNRVTEEDRRLIEEERQLTRDSLQLF